MPLQWPDPEQCRNLAPGPGVFQLGVSVEPLGALRSPPLRVMHSHIALILGKLTLRPTGMYGSGSTATLRLTLAFDAMCLAVP